MTQSDKAQRVYRAMAQLRNEYGSEGRHALAGVMGRLLSDGPERLRAESAARLYDLLNTQGPAA